MADKKIDLSNYETVDERVGRFHEKYPTARVITEIIAMEGTIGSTRWVVKASVYRNDDQDRLPDATGLAFEIDGAGMAQQAAALETCETSAIGRALANLGLSGNKNRASQSEMRKVFIADLLAQIGECTQLAALEQVMRNAQQQGVLDAISDALYQKRAVLQQQAAPATARGEEAIRAELATAGGDGDKLRALWKEAHSVGLTGVCSEIEKAFHNIPQETSGEGSEGARNEAA